MPSAVTTVRVMLALLCVIPAGCTDHALEREFFRRPLDTRVERLRHYSLEDQYRIFRYGNDVVHPPLTNLAIPIAERGVVAVPFLMAQLNTEKDDLAVRDILRLFQETTRLKTYDVRTDATLMKVLDSRISKMKDKEWQAICVKMLQAIKSS